MWLLVVYSRSNQYLACVGGMALPCSQLVCFVFLVVVCLLLLLFFGEGEGIFALEDFSPLLGTNPKNSVRPSYKIQNPHFAPPHKPECRNCSYACCRTPPPHAHTQFKAVEPHLCMPAPSLNPTSACPHPVSNPTSACPHPVQGCQKLLITGGS